MFLENIYWEIINLDDATPGTLTQKVIFFYRKKKSSGFHGNLQSRIQIPLNPNNDLILRCFPCPISPNNPLEFLALYILPLSWNCLPWALVSWQFETFWIIFEAGATD